MRLNLFQALQKIRDTELFGTSLSKAKAKLKPKTYTQEYFVAQPTPPSPDSPTNVIPTLLRSHRKDDHPQSLLPPRKGQPRIAGSTVALA